MRLKLVLAMAFALGILLALSINAGAYSTYCGWEC